MKVNHQKLLLLLEELACGNSEKALEGIYYMYSEPVSRYILMYVKSKEVAEELLSDVFYTVWEKRKVAVDIENFHAYIYSIAKFKALNYLRDQKMETIDLDQIPIDIFAFTKTTAEEEYISQETISQLNEAIEELPPKCKMAFKLVKEDNMKYKDAAEHLGISIKTLEIHLTTAMKKLKEKLYRLNKNNL